MSAVPVMPDSLRERRTRFWNEIVARRVARVTRVRCVGMLRGPVARVALAHQCERSASRFLRMRGAHMARRAGSIALRVLRVIDEDPPHRLSSGGKEMPLAFPNLDLGGVHQAEVGLVNQCRGLQGLLRRLLPHLPSRECAKLLVYQRQEVCRRLCVARGGFVDQGGNPDNRRVESLVIGRLHTRALDADP